MTIFFKSRTELRSFAGKNGKKTDRGSQAAKRWAFEVKKG